jgi:hypothetical protein
MGQEMTTKLTNHDWELIQQLHDLKAELRAEGRELREMSHTKFKQANSLSDQAIAEKFEVSKSTIARRF